jgi:hypothetical protein
MVQKWMRNLSKQHSKLIYLFSFLIVFLVLVSVNVDASVAAAPAAAPVAAVPVAAASLHQATTITGTLPNLPHTYTAGQLVLGPDNQVYIVAEGQTLTTHPTAPRNSRSAYIYGLILNGVLEGTVQSFESLTPGEKASVLMTYESYDTTTNNIVTSTASAAAGTPGSTSASGSTPSQTKKNNRAERTPANWSALWTGASGLQLFNSLLAVGSGPSTVNSLLYDEDKQAEVKNKAREIMNEYFDMYRLSLWIDEWLCTSNIPRLPAGTAVAMSETGESLEITVHVSGERSFFTMYNETNVTTGDVTASLKYFYKLSTTVSNKFFENKTIKFNVYLGTASNQLQTKLYNNTVELNRGETFTISYGSSLHPDPVSDSYYNRICISFTENPPSVGSTINPITIRNPFCNVIEAVTTTSTSYVRPSYLDSSSSSSGSSGSAGTTTQSPNQI